MFVLTHYFKSRQGRVKAWEDAGKAEVRRHQANDNYNYYSFRDWELDNPKPVFDWGKFFAYALPVFVGVGVTIAVVFALTNHNPVAKTHHPNNNPSGCSVVVKKGQKIGVSYGDFQGSTGTVLRQNGDCSVDIILTDSSNTFDKCKKSDNSSYCSGTKENGATLHIVGSNNVVPLT